MTGVFRNDNKKVSASAGGEKLTAINTPKNRHRAINMIRQAMLKDLGTALRACEKLRPAATQKAGALISDLKSIKQQVESRATTLGYSERCRQAIPVCGGECCVWHFPKTLTPVDFFIAVFDLAADERRVLVKQIENSDNEHYRCPLLQKDGCAFSFENRPIVCTNAFPCLAGTQYWQYKEQFRKDIEAIYTVLGGLLAIELPGPVN